MDLAGLFVTSFVVGLSGAMMPGPMLTVTIADTPRGGLRTGPLLVLGHGVVEGLVVVGLMLGLSQVIQLAAVKGTVALLGGVVLVWMGFGMGRAAWGGTVSLNSGGEEASRRSEPVRAGALLSATNPYWLLWWATIGATYVASSLELGTLGLASFFGGHILSDLAWFSLVGALVAGGKRLLTDRLYRGLILVCGAFLVGLGGYFFSGGLGFLLHG